MQDLFPAFVEVSVPMPSIQRGIPSNLEALLFSIFLFCFLFTYSTTTAYLIPW